VYVNSDRREVDMEVTGRHVERKRYEVVAITTDVRAALTQLLAGDAAVLVTAAPLPPIPGVELANTPDTPAAPRTERLKRWRGSAAPPQPVIDSAVRRPQRLRRWGE
jgi:hypothetical protein